MSIFSSVQYFFSFFKAHQVLLSSVIVCVVSHFLLTFSSYCVITLYLQAFVILNEFEKARMDLEKVIQLIRGFIGMYTLSLHLPCGGKEPRDLIPLIKLFFDNNPSGIIEKP